jgi:excinuclease ABC subunit C
MNRDPRLAGLAGEIRRRVPEGPGVYRFLGDREAILYIGKAINLRRRMLGHLRVTSTPDEPRHSRLVFEIRDFDYESTESELLALLREDELIKTTRPPFNVRQNEYLEYRYLELTGEECPRLRMCDHAGDFAGRQIFGPYRDRFLVESVLRLVHEQLGLRSCADPRPRGPCLEFDLGHCVGPCRSEVTPGDYRRTVERCVAFLAGEVSEVAGGLQQAMERAAAKLEFEKAQALKERLQFCHRLGERQRFLAAFRERELVIVESGDPGRTYLFRRGQLATHGLSGAADADPRFLLDRASVVHGWLRRNAGRCAHRFLDPA